MRDDEYAHLCMMPNASRYSFMADRRFCSMPKDHDPEETPHIAYAGHDLNASVAWYGPWQDNTPWRDEDGSLVIPEDKE